MSFGVWSLTIAPRPKTDYRSRDRQSLGILHRSMRCSPAVFWECEAALVHLTR